jgi:hypothetical protein
MREDLRDIASLFLVCSLMHRLAQRAACSVERAATHHNLSLPSALERQGIVCLYALHLCVW